MTIIFKNKAGSLYTASLLWTNKPMRIVIDTIKNKTGESNQIRSDVDIILSRYMDRWLIHVYILECSDFNKLIGFTSKKLPHIISNNFYWKS